MAAGFAAAGETRNYDSVQALRGVAVMLVIAFHVTLLLRDRMGFNGSLLVPGAAGVDLFFVISGFIMAVTTSKIWGTCGRAGDFLVKRCIRIFPLYWLATSLKLLLVVAVPSMAQHSELGLWHTVASYLLIPAWNAEHYPFPLLPVGWTLSFEMLFYVFFALCLWRRLNPVYFLTPIFMGFAGLYFVRPLEWGAIFVLLDPVVLEFVMGLWIGWATLHRKRLPEAWAWIVLLLATVCLALTYRFSLDEALLYRVVIWGGPAAAILFAAVSLEQQKSWSVPKLAMRLGDASYVLYLIQAFTLPVCCIAILKLHLPTWMAIPLVICSSIIVTVSAGLYLHYRLELPLLQWLRNLYAGRAKVITAP